MIVKRLFDTQKWVTKSTAIKEFTSFHLMKDQVTFLRTETIAGIFLYLMLFFYKVIINHTSKSQYVRFLCCIPYFVLFILLNLHSNKILIKGKRLPYSSFQGIISNIKRTRTLLKINLFILPSFLTFIKKIYT